MNLLLSFILCTTFFVILTFLIPLFNRQLFKTTRPISRKWTSVVLSYMILLFVLITPETNELDHDLKKYLIYLVAGNVIVYMLANTIKDGMSVKYKDIEIDTRKD